MKQLLKNLAIDILAPANGFATALTNKAQVHALVEKLHPISQSKQLIRLGPNGDGGYLVPDDLEGIEACFSPGVCEASGFEKDCAIRGMKVFLADKSVDRPAESHELFHFAKKYIGVTTNEEFMTIDDWVDSSLPKSQSDLMLQIDIEGYEYETILAASDELMTKFRIIVVEFHNLDQLWNRYFFMLASRAFEKILQTHTCVHIHPNNHQKPLKKGGLSIPPVAEFTFLRNDRISNATYASVFPHPLDFDTANAAHFPLPACWYRT